MKRLLQTLVCALLAVAFVGCHPEEEAKSYPELETLNATLWYSYDQTTATYYDVTFGATNGEMVGYSDPERTAEVCGRSVA